MFYVCAGAAAACKDAEVTDLDEKKFRFMLNQVRNSFL
jgi:hypothetical protein